MNIRPNQLRVGDTITSDPRRDYTITAIETDDTGWTTIHTGDGAMVDIRPDQTVTINRAGEEPQ